MIALLKGFIRNGRVEVDEPVDWPDGTEVSIAPQAASRDDGPATPEEIACVLAAMRQLQPLEIPAEVEADLGEWERKINRHGIDRGDAGIEDVFR